MPRRPGNRAPGASEARCCHGWYVRRIARRAWTTERRARGMQVVVKGFDTCDILAMREAGCRGSAETLNMLRGLVIEDAERIQASG